MFLCKKIVRNIAIINNIKINARKITAGKRTSASSESTARAPHAYYSILHTALV